ncbi:cyclophilin-like fold protein [Paenibacillus sp. LPE1-1-1.1]|uniref:cyclophilin-like fold protein n=1 Tax=Paenibacillus sp. LPE1-1-1.1 TaxID=3135230 RepID=UPI00343C6095
MKRNRVITIYIACAILITGSSYFIYLSATRFIRTTQESDNNQTPDVEQNPEEVPISSETENSATLRIVVGDQTLTAVLWENPASESLLAQLPLTLDFEDYGGRELIAEPPQSITMEGMPERDSPKAGDLSYYAPSNALSLTYSDLGEWAGAVRLGRIEGDLSILRGNTEPVMVTVERVE